MPSLGSAAHKSYPLIGVSMHYIFWIVLVVLLFKSCLCRLKLWESHNSIVQTARLINSIQDRHELSLSCRAQKNGEGKVRNLGVVTLQPAGYKATKLQGYNAVSYIGYMAARVPTSQDCRCCHIANLANKSLCRGAPQGGRRIFVFLCHGSTERHIR